MIDARLVGAALDWGLHVEAEVDRRINRPPTVTIWDVPPGRLPDVLALLADCGWTMRPPPARRTWGVVAHCGDSAEGWSVVVYLAAAVGPAEAAREAAEAEAKGAWGAARGASLRAVDVKGAWEAAEAWEAAAIEATIHGGPR